MPTPSLAALPGETYEQYETRLGAMKAPAGSGAGFGTPIPVSTAPTNANNQNGAMTPVEASTGQSGINAYDSRLAALVKQPMEDAANAPGLNLGSDVPTRTTDTSKTKTTTGTEDFSLSDLLAKIGTAPAAPSAMDTYNKLAGDYDVAGIQTKIADLDKQISDAELDTENKVNLEKGKPVASVIINGRVAKISAEAAAAISKAKAERTGLVSQLTNANTTISKIMSLQQTDYQNAHNSYTDQFNKAIQLFNAQESQMNKEQAAASANAKVLIDAYKGSNAALNITASDRANWSILETQAGLPNGFIESAIKAQKTSGVKIDHWTTGNDGTTYAFGTDSTGNPVLLKSFANTGKTTTTKKTGSSATVPDYAKTGMEEQLKSVRGYDGYISPESWATGLAAWVNEGYDTSSFEAEFSKYKNPKDTYSTSGSSRSTTASNTRTL